VSHNLYKWLLLFFSLGAICILNWTPEEISLLKRLMKENIPEIEIAKHFPHRSLSSVRYKIYSLKKKQSDIRVSPEDYILETLRESSFPIEASDLLSFMNADLDSPLELEDLSYYISILRRQGYDIKEIPSGKKKYYTLVRFGDRNLSSLYRTLGQIRIPFICSSDWHVGSVGYSPLLMKELQKDVEEYNVKDLVMAGDLLQGRGVHKRELVDLVEPDIQRQMDTLVDILHSFPEKTRFHMTIGGHEEHLKGSIDVGLDALRVVAQRVDTAYYYGAVAKLRLEKDWSLVMTHGSGGAGYARSYKPERLWDSLLEKPDFLVLGHLHVLSVFSKGKGHYIVQSGTLQRENSYLIWKGLTPQLGWIIIEDYNGETAKYIIREPKVY